MQFMIADGKVADGRWTQEAFGLGDLDSEQADLDAFLGKQRQWERFAEWRDLSLDELVEVRRHHFSPPWSKLERLRQMTPPPLMVFYGVSIVGCYAYDVIFGGVI